MSQADPLRAVLDADIIFSRVLHELMGRVADDLRLLDLVWSDDLLTEARRSLVEKKGLTEEVATRWVDYLPRNFPDGRTDVAGAETVDPDTLTVDPDDHHVCALAIASRASYLFTHDRGYLREALRGQGVEVTAPDPFLVAAFDADPEGFLERSSSCRPVAGREGGRSRSCWRRSSGPGRSVLPARRVQRSASEPANPGF